MLPAGQVSKTIQDSPQQLFPKKPLFAREFTNNMKRNSKKLRSTEQVVFNPLFLRTRCGTGSSLLRSVTAGLKSIQKPEDPLPNG